MTNFGATLLAASMLTADEFGTFALLITTYTLALGVARSLSTEPMLVRGEGAGGLKLKVSSTAGASLLLGAVCLFMCAIFAYVVPTHRATTLAFGLSFPLLLAQDAIRYSAFAAGRGGVALAADVTWLVGAASGYLALLPHMDHSSVSFYLVWSVSGGIAGLGLLFVIGAVPHVPHGLRWMVAQRDMGWRYVADFLGSNGAGQLYLFVVAAVAGISSLGAIRASQTLFGPLNVVFAGLFLAVVPEGVALLRRSPKSLFRFAALISSGGVALAALLLLALLLMPESWGVALLGETWSAAQALLLPIGLSMIMNGLQAGAAAGLRSANRPRAVLNARLASMPTMIGIPVLGAVFGGASGAAYGLALAWCISALAYWFLFRATLVTDFQLTLRRSAS